MDNNPFLLSGNPWYLSLDGVLFIVKDASETLREMTADEKTKYASKGATSSTGGYTSTYVRPKETGLKIKVLNPAE